MMVALLLWTLGPGSLGPMAHRAPLRECCRRHCAMAMRGAAEGACTMTAGCCHTHQAVVSGTSGQPWSRVGVVAVGAPALARPRANVAMRALSPEPSQPAAPPPRA